MNLRAVRHRWLKLHIAVDPKTGQIVSESTTYSHIHDGQALRPVLDQAPSSIRTVLADGAYDGSSSRKLRACHQLEQM